MNESKSKSQFWLKGDELRIMAFDVREMKENLEREVKKKTRTTSWG